MAAITVTISDSHAIVEDVLRQQFELYDINKDGNLSRDELHQMLQSSVASCKIKLKPDEMEAAVDSIMECLDRSSALLGCQWAGTCNNCGHSI